MPPPEPNVALNIQRNRTFRRTQLPRPYPDPAAYQENMRLALAGDPRRRENYERYQRNKWSATPDFLPIKLDIENVSRCNFRCTMCQVSDWGPTYQRGADMSLEDFKRLIDEQYGLVEVKLQGIGEPLLARDTFFEMIKYARSKHIWVRTTTNASLLHFQDNHKKLIASGVNEVQISFDGATKATFEQIRRGSKFELVVANCKLINGYCNERGLLKTRMWVVVQRHNMGELFQFIPLAAEMGFKRLTFSLELTDWGQQSWSEKNKAVTVEDLVTPEMAHEAIAWGKEHGVEVTWWDITDKYSTESVDTLCRWPFERAFVSSDMRIVPCCIIGNPNVADLGDARQFTKTWQGEAFREFREAHLKGQIPSYCQLCYKSKS